MSQHLRVLKRAGLVVDATASTRRLYRIDRAGLQAVRDYLDRLWATALDDFAALAAAEAARDAVAEAESLLDPPPDDTRRSPS